MEYVSSSIEAESFQRLVGVVCVILWSGLLNWSADAVGANGASGAANVCRETVTPSRAEGQDADGRRWSGSAERTTTSTEKLFTTTNQPAICNTRDEMRKHDLARKMRCGRGERKYERPVDTKSIFKQYSSGAHVCTWPLASPLSGAFQAGVNLHQFELCANFADCR